MAGTLLGVSNTQQHDTNGQPLVGGLLTIYQGGTTTLANVFQDIGLVLPAPNPLVADASGRLPLFFLSDGIYAARLTDQYGVQSNGGFFLPQIPSIGASTSGGGGSAVDPNSIFSTGDWKWRPSAETLAGWVRMNGKTIGNASSGASERANADTQALFVYAWQTYPDTKCPVLGGRGASALSDFNAGKQITLLDMRGRGPVGLDDMGNAAAGRISTGNMGGSGEAVTTGGAYGGESNHTLSQGELPAAALAVSASGGVSVTTNVGGGNVIPFTTGFASSSAVNGGGISVPASSGPWGASGSISSSGSVAVSGVTSNMGNGFAHNNCQPFVLGTHYWRL